MSFPLTHLKPYQRLALGLGNSRALIVRLYQGDEDDSTGFCIHLNPEVVFPVPAIDNQTTCLRHGGHYSWQVDLGSSAPDVQFCTGRPSRILYQISRDLWRHLANGFVSLEETYNFVIAALETLSCRCTVCGDSLGLQLLRSTTCKKACSIGLRRSSLEVRLADLRQDPLVVDLLLAMVHAVCSSSSTGRDTELLPGNPLRNGPTLRAIDNFPTTSSIRGVDDLAAMMHGLGRNTERLLSWMCTSYRGFLASARGSLKVPSMPGVYQFVLVNASPEKEMAFDAHLHTASSEVVFHGTSLDRMYAILRDGLRIMSAGPLQKHGAIHGSGIYVADEPRTAWSYATPPTRGADSSWLASDMHNTRVLLGCEMVKSGQAATQGVRIITDESQIMVRYIFMCPDGMVLPIAAHIVPALKSALNSLRIGYV